MPASDPRIADLVAAGKIRLALFLPQFSIAPTGELKGHGTGLIAIELMRAFAERNGIAMEVVQCPTPSNALERLQSDGCDVNFAGIEPSRVKIVDFTPAVFEFDYAYMVPAGSAIRHNAEVDRPGVRIAIVGNHASALALGRLVKHATMVAEELPEASFALLRDGKADVFALPRDVLLGFAARLPGSRVLDESFGFNRVGIAMRKGRPERVAALSEFVEDAKRTGLVADIITRNAATLPGFRAAPAGG